MPRRLTRPKRRIDPERWSRYLRAEETVDEKKSHAEHATLPHVKLNLVADPMTDPTTEGAPKSVAS